MQPTLSPTKLLLLTALRLTLLVVAIGLVLRIIMICLTGPAALDMTFWQYVGSFIIGAVNDVAFTTLALAPLWLFTITITDRKFARPTGYILLGLLAAATIYFTWLCPALADFNRGLAKAVRWIMLYWTLTFALRMFLPRIRRHWTRFWFAALLFVYIIVIYLNAAGEFFFWNEFEVRYNFIAVDYLVYTTEVIGNIMESYPIIPLAAVIVAITLATEWLLMRRIIRSSDALYQPYHRLRFSAIYIGSAIVAFIVITSFTAFQKSENTYYNELQANGPYRFFDAFLKNRLDYHKFYETIPADQAEAILIEANPATPTIDSTLIVNGRPNIVLITMESMSADFLRRFGNTDNLTPTLDSLYTRSIAFDRLFANGNRTVRGLEALSLALPPSAGQSLIKRPEIKPQQSIGSILRDSAGYRPVFVYGGKSYFDNMGPFFDGLGYDVIDIDSLSASEITFKNVWGVCDEDSYSKALSVIDQTVAQGNPAFIHLMTISNHRPYTYPEGRIDIPTDSKSRAGGVKYSDYALGRFMRQAAAKPWFNNTIFVIVADHCASSAGSTELPLKYYHIPAMIYAPALLEPRTVGHTVSQIDLMPTVLAMIGVDTAPLKYGRNALSPDYRPRAFLATYQDLGFVSDDLLTVLSPVKRVRQYNVVPTADNPFNIELAPGIDSLHAKQAISFYQTSADANE